MVNTAREVLSPLLILASSFGFTVFEYPRGRLWPYFSYIYAFIFWTLFTCLTVYLTLKYVESNVFANTATLPLMVVNLFTAIVTCAMNLHHNKDLQTAIDGLDSVLDTMEKLGSTKDVAKLKRKVKWKIGIWGIASICLNSTDYVWWNSFFDLVTAIVVPTFLNSSYHINVINDIVIETILIHVESKFDCVNEYVRSLTKDTEKMKKQTRCMTIPLNNMSSENTNNCKHLIWTSMHLHLELRKICRSLNAIYGVQLVLQMINNFAFVTAMIYYAYVAFISNYHSFDLPTILIFLSWEYLYFRKFFNINYYCEIVSRKANEITTVTQSLMNVVNDEELCEEMKQFILYSTYFPLKFTGQGFFEFGYTFIQKFLSMSATFLVIVMQMYKPSKTDR